MKKYGKRLLAFLLACALLCAGLPAAAAAVQTPTLRIEYAYDADASCIAEVTVFLDEGAGMTAGAFSMQFDTSLLKYIGASGGDAGGMTAADCVGDTVYMSAAFTQAIEQESVALLHVRFGVLAAGSALLQVSVTDKQTRGIRAPGAASREIALEAPRGGMPYYLYQLQKDGTLKITDMITDRSYLEVPSEIDGSAVTAIGAHAFEGMTDLKGVTLPEGLRRIETAAFADCVWLKSVVLPESLTQIGARAFYHCSSLTQARLPDGVQAIEAGAFRYCASLTEISLPSAVAYLGDRAFADCRSLRTVSFGGLRYVGVGAFEGCAALQAVSIPGSVSQIGERAFANCRALTTLALADGTEAIEDSAFEDCASLRAVQIPASVKSIGACAFARCDALESIRTDAGNTAYRTDRDAALYNADRTELLVFAPAAPLREYALAAQTVIVDARAFENCKTLEAIAIPASVADIGKDAFFGCSSLRTLSVAEENATYFNRDGALYSVYTNFAGETEVTLEYLPAAAAQTVFEVPADVGAIADRALMDALQVEAYAVAPEHAVFSADADGVLMNAAQTELIAYPAARRETSYTVPGNVRFIRAGAFYGASALADFASDSIYFKVDDSGALLSADKTELAVYPAGRRADRVVVPVTVSALGEAAFAGVTGVGTLELPETVAQIGDMAFYNSGVAALAYGGSEEMWHEILQGARNDGLFAAARTYAAAAQEPADLTPAEPSVPDTPDDPPAPTFTPGDVNADGHVNSADARLALRIVAKLYAPDETQRRAADINGDGRVTSADARTILRISARLESLEAYLPA